MNEINETTWIYTSKRFAPPGAPVGLPKWDFPCEVSVRPGLSFVKSAGYRKCDDELPGIWFSEENPIEPLSYLVYAWRMDRRLAAPISSKYEDERALVKSEPKPKPGEDTDYDAYKLRNAPENCFREVYPIEEENAETTSTARYERYYNKYTTQFQRGGTICPS